MEEIQKIKSQDEFRMENAHEMLKFVREQTMKIADGTLSIEQADSISKMLKEHISMQRAITNNVKVMSEILKWGEK